MESRFTPRQPQGGKAVYWTYAVIAWAAGLLCIGWGPHWLFHVYGMKAIDLPGQPFGMAAIIRVFGAFIATLGCFAAAVARINDPAARFAARPWFLLANCVVFGMIILQQHAVFGGGAPESGAELLLIVVFIAVLFGSGDPYQFGLNVEMTTLFGRAPAVPSAVQLRSAYEERIREAAQQEERNRLARELHDSIKQQLFVVQTAAATAQTRWEQDAAGARTALEQVRKSARDAMTEMEVMLDQLRASPLEKVGLVQALKQQCEALELRTGASVTFNVSDLPDQRRLLPGSAQALFRIAQEALSNVSRHARATRVRVSLGPVGNEIHFGVEDDGSGFEPGSPGRDGGMGLTNMRQRASDLGGDLEVWSRPGKGTKISVSIPCLPPDLGLGDYRDQVKLWGGLLVVQAVVVFAANAGRWSWDALFMNLIPASFLVRSIVRLRQRQRETGVTSRDTTS